MYGNDYAIVAENLSKLYRIGLKSKSHDTFGGAMIDFIKSPLDNYRKYRSLYRFDDQTKESSNQDPEDIIRAIDNISFKIKEGEVVGFIGTNGAGKSTLLKILSRITSPTSGKAEIRGKVGCLLEVGTGFHLELTGRENIYLNGSILGMRKTEIDRKLDAIIEFSGVEKFIDTPVKRYSSGMKVRVGFAVAAHLEPEILIIDEVLAVGDIEFQQKCIGKMRDVANAGRTVLFVSHNLSAVRALCTRGIIISDGKIVMDAPVEQTINRYIEDLGNPSGNPFEENSSRSGSHVARFTKARILAQDGNEISSVTAGKPVTFELNYENLKDIPKAFISLTIYNMMGVPAINFDMEIRGFKIGTLAKTGKILCHIENLPLPIGRYRVAIAMIHKGIGMADHIPNALFFNIEDSVFFPTGRTPQIKNSTCMASHEWEHIADDY